MVLPLCARTTDVSTVVVFVAVVAVIVASLTSEVSARVEEAAASEAAEAPGEKAAWARHEAVSAVRGGIHVDER